MSDDTSPSDQQQNAPRRKVRRINRQSRPIEENNSAAENRKSLITDADILDFVTNHEEEDGIDDATADQNDIDEWTENDSKLFDEFMRRLETKHEDLSTKYRDQSTNTDLSYPTYLSQQVDQIANAYPKEDLVRMAAMLHEIGLSRGLGGGGGEGNK